MAPPSGLRATRKLCPEQTFDDAGQKSACGKWRYDGRESASKKVENYWESPPQVDLFTGESFDLVTAR
jgi:hypothetical protein